MSRLAKQQIVIYPKMNGAAMSDQNSTTCAPAQVSRLEKALHESEERARHGLNISVYWRKSRLVSRSHEEETRRGLVDVVIGSHVAEAL